MPLLGKEEFILKELPDGLLSDDEVFYCQLTGEAFTSYDEYFERQMLYSSLLWTCSITGKTGLTYADAIKSEKESQILVSSIPRVLQKALLHLTKYMDNFSLNIVLTILTEYTNLRYFIGENVHVVSNNKTKRSNAYIRDVIPPEVLDTSNSIAYGIDPLSYQYSVEIMDDKKYVSNVGPTVEILPASKITRPKCLLTREKLRLFLKCHSSQKSRGDTWNLKEESINKFALDRIRWEDIFKGPTPNFNDDTTILKQFSKRLSEGYQNVEPKSFSIDESDKTEEDGHCLSIQVVKKKSNLISTQKQKLSNKKEKIQKIVNNERTDKKKKRKLTKKQKLKEKVKGKKLKLKGQMRKSSTQEPSSNPSEKPAIDKIEEKRRIKESRRRFEEDLRLWSEKREDLLCDDLKPLPTPIPIECDIEERHFGDSILILEFICVFQDYINDFHNWFPSGISLELFSQILNETSINGPFGDLLRTLLGTILMSHVDYDPDNGSELKVEIKTGDDFDSYTNINEDDELNNFCDNNYSNNWVSTYFGTQEQLLKLRLDEFTLSEILRLYLLKARLDGNSKQLRRNEDDDMTLAIRLTSCTVYEFNQLERVQLFKLLLNDLVKVPQIRQKIEISMDEMFRLKTQIRHINAAHTKWLRDNPIRQRIRKRKVTVDEIANKDDVTDQTENEASQLEKDQYKKEKLQKEHQMKKSISELKGKIRQLSAFCRPRPLGMDRAYRRYWIFQSVPGLFVEHSFDEIQTRPCLESPTPTPKPQFNDYLPNAKRRKRKSKVVEENDVSVKMDDVAQPADLNSTELSKDIFDKCTGTLTTCSVHGLANSEKRVLWSFYTKDQLDNFIESLSNRGFRENELKTALTFEKLSIEKDHLSGLIPTVLNRNYLPPLIFDEFVGSDDDGTGLKRKSERIQNQNLEKATQATKLQDQTARHMRSDSKYSAYEPVEAHEHALQDELLLLEDKIFNSCFTSFTLEEREMWYTKVTENKSGNLYNSIANLTTQFQLLAKSLRPFCLMPPLSTIADSPISSPSDKENVEFAQPKVQKLSEKWSDVLKVAEGLETGNLFDYENSFGITSFSQIFINLYILEKSINWELSALKTATKCRICRRKANDEMILCDMCNRGYHIYCLKPPIKSIEDVEGDWFCYTCVPRKSSGQQTLKSEPTTTTISNEELENRLSMRKDEHINQNDVEVMSNGDSLNTCYKCKKHLYDEYSEVQCKTCNNGFHLSCVKLVRVPRSWNCMRCEEKERYATNNRDEQPEDGIGDVRRSSRKRKPNHYYDDENSLDHEDSIYSNDNVKSKRYSLNGRDNVNHQMQSVV